MTSRSGEPTSCLKRYEDETIQFLVLAFSYSPSRLADTPAGREGPGAVWKDSSDDCFIAGGRGLGDGGWIQSMFKLYLDIFSLYISVGEKPEKLRMQEGRCREFLVSIVVLPRTNEAQGW